MKTPAKPIAKQPSFVRHAERALRRAARNVREENRRLGLPVLVWADGKPAKTPAN